jgi:hypothetical protein
MPRKKFIAPSKLEIGNWVWAGLPIEAIAFLCHTTPRVMAYWIVRNIPSYRQTVISSKGIYALLNYKTRKKQNEKKGYRTQRKEFIDGFNWKKAEILGIRAFIEKSSKRRYESIVEDNISKPISYTEVRAKKVLDRFNRADKSLLDCIGKSRLGVRPD